MILICAVLMACAVPAPTRQDQVCTTVQCFKDAQRKQYTKDCMRRNMQHYADLLSIGMQPEPPAFWCRRAARRVIK